MSCSCSARCRERQFQRCHALRRPDGLALFHARVLNVSLPARRGSGAAGAAPAVDSVSAYPCGPRESDSARAIATLINSLPVVGLAQLAVLGMKPVLSRARKRDSVVQCWCGACISLRSRIGVAGNRRRYR